MVGGSEPDRGISFVRVFVVLFALPFVLIGLGAIGFGLFQTGTAVWETFQYGQTEGTVTAATVESATVDGETVYYPRIEYTYRVNGESYTSERVFEPGNRGTDATPGREYGSRSGAEDVLDEYGGRVTVHYPNGDPGNGFLEDPTDGLLPGLVLLFLGIPFLGGGGLFMWFGLAAGEDEEKEVTGPGDAEEGTVPDNQWGSDLDDGGGGGFE